MQHNFLRDWNKGIYWHSHVRKILLSIRKTSLRYKIENMLPNFFKSVYTEHSVSRVSPRHYFNDISFTSRPFFLGSTCFTLFFYIVLFIKKYANITPVFLLLALCVFIFFLLNWFDDVIYESRLNGRYNRKIRAALVCGFICLLISEVLSFGGFFWAYFDRVFNPGYVLGSFCIPTGMENIDYWRWPLVGTFVPVTSGYFANNSYYFLRAGSWVHSVVSGVATIILAIVFPLIQLAEYNGLNITISDNVFGSFSHLSTGFHGFHVTVGLLFPCEQYSRLMIPLHRHRLWRVSRVNYLFNRDRNLGMTFALIYRHFVDIIWLFLFINVYVYNNISFTYWAGWILDYVFTKDTFYSVICKDPEFFMMGATGFAYPYLVPTYSFSF
jgi:heme/copper-type cytochrome/quinol oxidase subunit 3